MLAGVDDIEITGEAANAEEARKNIATARPDIVLLDIRMPGLDGLRFLRFLSDNLPDIKVIILTNYDEEQFLLEALKLGAYGYLIKNVGRETLLDTIRTVCAGKRILSQELMDSVLRQFSSLSNNTSEQLGLSETEINLLKIVAEGATNREIAERLYWSETTVKRKLSDVFEKLEVSDRAQAVAVAMRFGLF